MLVETSLSATDKKCMACVIMSSAVTWGCVIYLCKYSAVSVIINDLVLLSIEAVRTIFANWKTLESLPPEDHKVLRHPTPVIPSQAATPVRYPTLTSKGGQEKKRATNTKGAIQKKSLTITETSK